MRPLAVGAGKDAHIYVFDRDSMGRFNPSFNQIYQDSWVRSSGAHPPRLDWATSQCLPTMTGTAQPTSRCTGPRLANGSCSARQTGRSCN